MPTYTDSKRWVGSLAALAVLALGVAARAGDPSHVTEDPTTKNGGYVRERVGVETPRVNSYVETGSVTVNDDPTNLIATLTAGLVAVQAIEEKKTGEKKQSEASTLNKDQNRTGAVEKKRDDTF